MARILVIKLSSLGDLFHVLPAVHELKGGLGATVHWVTQSNYLEVVRCFTDVDHVLDFPRRRFLRQAPGYLRRLRAESYDYVFDFQGLLKSALLVGRMARGARRIGPFGSREGARFFYSETPASGTAGGHAVERALDVVRHLGLEAGEPVFPVSFPPRPLSEPHPRVALVPCSRWAAKNWAPARFVEVGHALRARRGASLFLVGGPEDHAVCMAIEAELGRPTVNTCGHTTLVEMGSLLQEMDLVVSVDSGPMHVAAARGVPVLAVFGATDPRRTGPYGRPHRVLTPEHPPEQGDLSRAYKRTGPPYAWDVPAEKVIAAALDMLS